MKPTLGGCLVVRDGIKYDYCTVEAIESLVAVCDLVKVIVFADSAHMEDHDLLMPLMDKHSNLMVTASDYSDWDTLVRGKERIAHFQNMAKAQLGTDWYISLQADEVLHEASFETIRQAINYPMAEGYLNWRLNLWGSPYTYLHVPPKRKPCSDVVLRLAKIGCDSYGDGESIACSSTAANFVKDIRIYHMGFVRRRDVMTEKIKNMQLNVFELGDYDELCKKDEAQKSGLFDPWTRFAPTDVAPIPEKLPVFVQKWAQAREWK